MIEWRIDKKLTKTPRMLAKNNPSVINPNMGSIHAYNLMYCLILGPVKARRIKRVYWLLRL